MCAVSVMTTAFPALGVKVAATPVDGGYVINGVKTWATFAGRATVLLVLARTDPDRSKGHRGLSVLLVMVVVGISSVGAGAAAGIFLGGPTLANFFPTLTQLNSVLVGAAGTSVGTTPNGAIPSGLRPLWLSVLSLSMTGRYQWLSRL